MLSEKSSAGSAAAGAMTSAAAVKSIARCVLIFVAFYGCIGQAPI